MKVLFVACSLSVSGAAKKGTDQEGEGAQTGWWWWRRRRRSELTGNMQKMIEKVWR